MLPRVKINLNASNQIMGRLYYTISFYYYCVCEHHVVTGNLGLWENVRMLGKFVCWMLFVCSSHNISQYYSLLYCGAVPSVTCRGHWKPNPRQSVP